MMDVHSKPVSGASMPDDGRLATLRNLRNGGLDYAICRKLCTRAFEAHQHVTGRNPYLGGTPDPIGGAPQPLVGMHELRSADGGLVCAPPWAMSDRIVPLQDRPFRPPACLKATVADRHRVCKNLSGRGIGAILGLLVEGWRIPFHIRICGRNARGP